VDFAGDMSYMFKNCSALTSLDMSNFKTLRATNMKGMFSGCSKLTSLDVLGFSTGNVTDMSGMFENCSELETIDVSRFYTINVTNMASMFAGCSKVSKLDLLNFNTSKVKSVGKMFKDCDALVNLDLSRFDLRYLDGSTYYKEDGNKDINQVEMFNGCTNLYTMVLGKNFARLDGANMFTGCNALVSIMAQSTSAMTLGTTTGLNTLTNAVLYVPKISVEASYESASNYLSVFGANRVKPMIEVIGDDPVYAELYKEYKDAGAKIAGFDKANENEYKKYGYSLTVENADVDTNKIGTTKVIYKLKYFDTMIDIFEK
jgi:surface protein